MSFTSVNSGKAKKFAGAIIIDFFLIFLKYNNSFYKINLLIYLVILSEV